MNTTLPQIIVPDAILTEFYEEYKGNIGRLDRAIQLVEAGHVERSNLPGLWLVRSASVENGSYRVVNGCCNCADTARVGAQNCKHAIGVRIFRAAERAEVEQSDPTLDEDPPSCPLHGDEECDWGCPGPSLDPLKVVVEPSPEDRYELTGRAYLAFVPTAALPNAIGTCVRWGPSSARGRALSEELFGGDAA